MQTGILKNPMESTGEGLASDKSSRLQTVAAVIDLISSQFAEKDVTPTIAEKSSLEKAKSHMRRLIATHQANSAPTSATLSAEDDEFSDTFLDAFTTKAFRAEIDSIRVSEGDSMTESDMATLANSIRSFGLGLSEAERSMVLGSLSNTS